MSDPKSLPANRPAHESICDRILDNAHRLDLKGPTKRRTKTEPEP